MNLLDRYCAEVGQHLARANRADIEKEIRSTLEDMLNDRSRASGQPVDEALITAVLKEYGAPAKVAAAYQPAPYLIGPRLYPVFALVLKIVLTVLFGLALAGLAVSVISRPGQPALLAGLGQFGPQFLGSAVSAFGMIVLAFALLDRYLPAAAFETDEKDWDPAELAQTPAPDDLKRPELILNVVMLAIVLVILDFYPNLIRVGLMSDGQWTFIPILSSAFFGYRPWITLLGVAQIAFDLFLLTRPAWQPGTRLAAIALKLGGIALAFVMLTGPSLVALSPASVAGTPFASVVDVMAPFFNLGVLITLIIVIVVTTIEAVQYAVRLLTRGALLRLPARK